MLNARFGAVCRVGVPTDFYLEHLHGSAIARLEEVIQNLVPLFGGVVSKEPRVTAAATDRADSVKGAACSTGVNAD